jgi:hypothetical protein
MYKTLVTPGSSPKQTDQVDTGKSYDPLLMSLIKSTSISVDEGRRQVKEGFLSLETIDTCVYAIQRVNGQDKRFSAFEPQEAWAGRTGLIVMAGKESI